MNNTELMSLLKRVNQNDVQRKYLCAMGVIIIAAGVGMFFLYERNNKMNITLQSIDEINTVLTIKSEELQADLLQKEGHIQKLTNEKQALQEIISAKHKENQNPI